MSGATQTRPDMCQEWTYKTEWESPSKVDSKVDLRQLCSMSAAYWALNLRDRMGRDFSIEAIAAIAGALTPQLTANRQAMDVRDALLPTFLRPSSWGGGGPEQRGERLMRRFEEEFQIAAAPGNRPADWFSSGDFYLTNGKMNLRWIFGWYGWTAKDIVELLGTRMRLCSGESGDVRLDLQEPGAKRRAITTLVQNLGQLMRSPEALDFEEHEDAIWRGVPGDLTTAKADLARKYYIPKGVPIVCRRYSSTPGGEQTQKCELRTDTPVSVGAPVDISGAQNEGGPGSKADAPLRKDGASAAGKPPAHPQSGGRGEANSTATAPPSVSATPSATSSSGPADGNKGKKDASGSQPGAALAPGAPALRPAPRSATSSLFPFGANPSYGADSGATTSGALFGEAAPAGAAVHSSSGIQGKSSRLLFGNPSSTTEALAPTGCGRTFSFGSAAKPDGVGPDEAPAAEGSSSSCARRRWRRSTDGLCSASHSARGDVNESVSGSAGAAGASSATSGGTRVGAEATFRVFAALGGPHVPPASTPASIPTVVEGPATPTSSECSGAPPSAADHSSSAAAAQAFESLRANLRVLQAVVANASTHGSNPDTAAAQREKDALQSKLLDMVRLEQLRVTSSGFCRL